MVVAHCPSWERKKLCSYYLLCFPFLLNFPPAYSYGKMQKELCCSLLNTLLLVSWAFELAKASWVLSQVQWLAVRWASMLKGSFATQPFLPVCNIAWKRGLQTLLSYYTSTKSINTENRVKQINLPSGTQGKSILIFRFKQEVTLEVSMPGTAAVSVAGFGFGANPSMLWQPGKASLCKHKAVAALLFRHPVGLEDGSGKLGSFCTNPVWEMYNVTMIQRKEAVSKVDLLSNN